MRDNETYYDETENLLDGAIADAPVCADALTAMAQLRARVAELEAENERLKSAIVGITQIEFIEDCQECSAGKDDAYLYAKHLLDMAPNSEGK